MGAKKFFCGPESFTPDGGPVVGEAPELKNYFLAAGMNSIGILSGGGLGRLLSHWILTGLPDMDVTGMNVDRFQVTPFLHPPVPRATCYCSLLAARCSLLAARCSLLAARCSLLAARCSLLAAAAAARWPFGTLLPFL